jgi:hypothetical protein
VPAVFSAAAAAAAGDGAGASGPGRAAAALLALLRSVLGVTARLAKIFAAAWRDRVSPGEMLYAGSPEGTGILAAQRGDDPFAVTTQLRTPWR